MISAVVVFVVVISAIFVLQSEFARREGQLGNAARVHWGIAFKAIGVFCLITFFVIIVDGVTTRNIIPAVVAATIYGGLAIPIFLHGFFWSISFNEAGLFCRSPWSRSRAIKWGDITVVTFSVSWRQWVIGTRRQGVVRVNELAVGSAQLISECRRRGVLVEGGLF